MKPAALLLCLLIASVFSLLALPAPAQEIRAFWVDGFAEGFKTPEQVDTLLRRMKAANCNAVFAQMRKGGDAYYQSRVDPWAFDNPQRFDALADLLKKAHASTPRIQVHAWLNTAAVGKTHGNPKHIAAAHPDWKSISDMGEDFDNEATKVDPGHPDAADWTFRVYLDVLRHYDVDGIHFDFVRYGSTDGKGNWGYNPVSVARFNVRHNRKGQPAWDDPLWKQWRRDQVTALVRKVYAMAAAARPKAAVSAATITWQDGPHTAPGMSARRFWDERSAPMNRVFQDWRSWMEEGILDLNCQMSYYREARHAEWFRHWIEWGKDNQYRRWAVPSTGAWLNPIPDSLKQIEAIRKPSRKGNKGRGALVYCYAATNTGPDGKEEKFNDAFYAALGAGPFASPVEFPAIPWKENPKTGIVSGFVHAADSLSPADGAKVTITGRARRTQRMDGTGFFAFVDLPPGRYRVTIEGRGYAPVKRDVEVKAGAVVDAGQLLGGSSAPLYQTPFRELAEAPSGSPVTLERARVVVGTDTFPGSLLLSTGGGPALRVRLAAPPLVAFQPGDAVTVIGRISVDGGERLVDSATARLVGILPPAGSAAPPPVLDANAPATAFGSERATIEGRVSAVHADRFTLGGPAAIEVMTAGRKGPGVEDPVIAFAAPERGSRVRVTGVCTVTEHDGKTLVRVYPEGPEAVTEFPTGAGEIAVSVLKWSALPALAAFSFLLWQRGGRRTMATNR